MTHLSLMTGRKVGHCPQCTDAKAKAQTPVSLRSPARKGLQLAFGPRPSGWPRAPGRPWPREISADTGSTWAQSSSCREPVSVFLSGYAHQRRPAKTLPSKGPPSQKRPSPPPSLPLPPCLPSKQTPGPVLLSRRDGSRFCSGLSRDVCVYVTLRKEKATSHDYF